MSGVLCSGCEQGRECTHWAVDGEPGNAHWVRCRGVGVVRITGSYLAERSGDEE
jgi:hypothetical protein